MVGFLRKIAGGGGSGSDPGDELGEDILDLTPVGGSWENIVRRFHDDARASDKAIDYIKTGKMSGVPTPSHPWLVLPARIKAVGAHRAHENLRLRSALLAALPSNHERDRAMQLYDRYGSWTSHGATAQLSALLGRTTLAGVDEVFLTVRDIEQLGSIFGWPPQMLEEALVYVGVCRISFGRIADGNAVFISQVGMLRAVLATPVHDHQYLWNSLRRASFEDLSRVLANEVCSAITANSKSLRSSVRELFAELTAEQKVAGLSAVLDSAKPAQRARVVEAAAELDPGNERDEFVAYLKKDLAGDRSAAVKEALEALDESESVVEDDVAPLVIPTDIPNVPERLFPTLQREWHTAALPAMNGSMHRSPSPWALAELLRTNAKVLKSMKPAHAARMIQGLNGGYFRDVGMRCLAGLRDSDLRPTPLDVTTTCRYDGRPDSMALETCAGVVGCDPDFWTDDEVTEWAGHHIAELIQPLDEKSNYQLDRNGYLALLGKIRPQPVRLRDAILQATVSGYKTDRAALQQAVDLDGVEPVLKHLSSRKKGERLGAAQLLRARQLPEASTHLLAAARKEKDEGVLVAMLAAIESNGASIEEFTSKEALVEQARKAMAKKNANPKAIEWLDVQALPTVTWTDGGFVDPTIMQWFIATAVKLKSAEPSPLMIDHFTRMNQSELRAFGSALLAIWLARDTQTHSVEDARLLATQQVNQNHAHWSTQQWSPLYGTTPAEAIAQLTSGMLKTPIGSESASKGVLGVVAGAAGGEVAESAGTYIRKHRGKRLTQSKTLVQMLAWIDDPAAIQLVLSIAGRFRPKGIQVEAAKQAELLAERRGWTLDDLADRSVPDAGFESNGRQAYDFGTRTFTASLGDDLTVSLTNDETGKTVRSLPKGRADEDPELIKELKKDFTAAKKELKTVAKIQPERLHFAMCSQRSWTVDDFMRYFVAHPVMARLASRLVWASTDGESAAVGFRPLTDGTLLTADDEEFNPPTSALITVGHQQLLEHEGVSWVEHFGDYEVTPLFAQFNRPVVPVEPGQERILDFEGFMYNDGAIRGQISKHGWQLGPAEDGGWVQSLVKDFASAGVTAVIRLYGGLPVDAYNIGENTLALYELYFVSSDQHSYTPVQLETVSPILLGEVFAEAEAIAAAGDGYDANYKNKTG